MVVWLTQEGEGNLMCLLTISTICLVQSYHNLRREIIQVDRLEVQIAQDFKIVTNQTCKLCMCEQGFITSFRDKQLWHSTGGFWI